MTIAIRILALMAVVAAQSTGTTVLVLMALLEIDAKTVSMNYYQFRSINLIGNLALNNHNKL